MTTINSTDDENMFNFNKEPTNDDDINPDDFTFESWDDEEVNLNKKLLRGIYSYGFEKPSPIQKKAVIPMVLKKDVIAQAQSGTGKTGAFTVGTIQLVDHTKDRVQAIIISPTRELSKQTYDVLKSI